MALIFLNSLMVVMLSNCLHKAREFAAYISPSQFIGVYAYLVVYPFYETRMDNPGKNCATV